MSYKKQVDTGKWYFISKDFVRVSILILLILFCVGTVYYFTFLKNIHIIFTHFFYIPIALAGFFWGRKSIWVAVFLGACLIFPHQLQILSTDYLIQDILRAVMFIVIAWVIGLLGEYRLDNEKMLSDIVEGNPIPTFVINKDHTITHFNSSCEALTGLSAEYMLGSKKQWMPYYSKERPTLADLIVDGASEEVITEYYQDRCRKWPFIQGSYEGEIFNSKTGGNGLWLYTTAAPIKNTKGKVLGAIETLADITERKRVEKELKERQEKLRRITDNMLDIICQTNMEGVLEYISPSIKNVLGYDIEDLLGRSIFEFVHPDDMDEVMTNFKKITHTLLQGKEELRYRHAEGYYLWLDVVGNILFDSNGQPIGVTLCARDITERKRIEMALHESEERYRRLVELSPDAICVHDGGRIVFANRAAAKLLGAANSEELIGKPVLDFVHPDYGESVRERIHQMLEERKDVPLIEEKFIRLDCTIVDVEVAATSFLFEGEMAVLVVFRDITKRKQAEETIRYQAYNDILTDLPNRMLLNDCLIMALACTRRNKEMLAVMFLDLDRFKNINDTLGHAIGDELLKSVAKRLTGLVRGVDTVARFGGDEFTILLPEISRAGEAAGIAQRILDAFKKPFMIKGYELYITTSIGISIYPAHGDNVETLLKNADIAMYRAKDRGRNNYQFFTLDMNKATLDRLNLANSLRHALEREELVIYYQPKVNINTGKVIGMEALVRWQHPDLGLVSPVEFIPLAEETGLIIPIGEWVLRTACVQNKAWQDTGFPPLSVAVNLSVLQFKQHDLIETINRILKETGLEPHYLEIEITETVAMDNVDYNIMVLRKLREMGVQISLDDFGTGYSSISYLEHFLLDNIKIDQSFVHSITMNHNNAAIVTSVIDMAHRLNLKVTAEGVETEEQFVLLKQRQCDNMQGYLFSKPLPVNEFEKILTQDKSLY